MSRKRTPGFTLIELMIVIAVIGILAGVGYGVYRSYIKSARASEATGILADIRLKQEAYRATFHQYACTAPVCGLRPTRSGAADWGKRMQWNATAAGAEWSTLGIRPDSGLWFSYSAAGGAPGVAPAAPFDVLFAANATNNDFWYAAMAFQDFEGDAAFGCFAIHSGVQFMKTFDEGDAVCVPGPP
ncbi:MAG: prepilin-type N-terminal cleavage/methylation domain-containing protein [Myxococcota bacterium]|jgi:prepilin-type N-terminal cleavage/methylation domain-containing protein|nr:prepilin-type N-terminal cleavage/methylation domain-containing protein [Myxococcota bacterium]